eukprot:4275577-Prymnesium_polylepis.1
MLPNRLALGAGTAQARCAMAECAGGACGRLRSLSPPSASRVERRVPRVYLVQYLCVFRTPYPTYAIRDLHGVGPISCDRVARDVPHVSEGGRMRRGWEVAFLCTRVAHGRRPDVCVPTCMVGCARQWPRATGGKLHAALIGDRVCAPIHCSRSCAASRQCSVGRALLLHRSVSPNNLPASPPELGVCA